MLEKGCAGHGAALFRVFMDRAGRKVCMFFCRFGSPGVTAWGPAVCGMGCFAAQKRPSCHAIRPVSPGETAFQARQDAGQALAAEIM